MDRADTILERVTQGYYLQDVPFEIPVSTYGSKSGIIVIISPGAGETKDGHKGRWATLAPFLQKRQVGAIVTYNPPLPDAQFVSPEEPYSYHNASWNQIVVESLRHVIDHTLDNAEAVCGSKMPTLYLAGFSAGGSACGAIAHSYPEINRILLISAYDSVGHYFYDGIGQYTKDIYMAYGSQDVMAGFLAHSMRFLAPMAASLEIQEVPECNHGFSGPENGKILSKAFIWAFENDLSFPSPEGGIPLYLD